MTRLTRPLLFLLLSSVLASCVYYNTFYNAKKRFRQAHAQRELAEADPDSRVLQKSYLDYYLSAIQKASVVLDLHPDSKWVDDALLLIGQAYYWRDEHGEALIKFDEILDNFPESDLRSETLYWKGISLWGNDEITQSRDLLLRLAESEDRTYAPQAQLALAELEQAQENYEIAVRAFLDLSEKTKDDELQTRLWKGLGDTYYADGQFDNAQNAYLKVLDTGPDDLTRYQTELQLGAVKEQLGDLDGALETYKRMEGHKRFRAYLAKIRLKISNVYRLKGDVDGALEAYQRIIDGNRRTEESAAAYYEIAMIELEERRDNEKALELFGEARRERSTSRVAERAREMETTLTQLERYIKRTERDGEDGSEALFNVAEIYLFNLGKVDSALIQYERVLAREDSTHLAKALYAIGLIYADSLDQTTEAEQYFSRLVEEHPVTPYAVNARRRLGRGRSDDVLAEARYIEAEELKTEGGDPREVVRILEQVTTEYPNSLFAPKARFALAWAYENDLQDLDTATKQYERLAEEYPLSDFAEVAEDKVKQIARSKRDQKRSRERAEREAKKAAEAAAQKNKETEDEEKAPSEAEKMASEERDSRGPANKSGQSKEKPSTPPIDTTGPLEADQVDRPPILGSRPNPPLLEELGEELMEEGVDPVVSMRALIGTDGIVKQAIVVKGSDLLHEQATELAHLYRFRPGLHEGKPREVWVQFEITFLLPGGEEGEPE